MRTFLERLDGEAKDLLLAVARPISHAKGERLVRYGDASRGAYLLKAGSAEATVLLPGGEKLTVARIGAGDVFGETALIERGTCTATVSATEKLEGWFIERDDFRSLVAQRVPAALRVQHALTLALSEKLRGLNAKVLEVAAPGDKPSARKANGADPLAGAKRSKSASFDFKPFLPHLGVFEGFDAAEIDEVVSISSVLELPRGQKVFTTGQPSSACFIVVRGAVKIRAQHEKRERRIAVLGPGQLLGYMSALEKSVHGSDAVVREQALLLEIPGKEFEKLYFGSSPASTKLHRVIQKSLL
ncbi:MAG: cyclic nucleotide-binding domain-containing protein, partial [Panacagrimonas sp.]